jgi:hypothetical protein
MRPSATAFFANGLNKNGTFGVNETFTPSSHCSINRSVTRGGRERGRTAVHDVGQLDGRLFAVASNDEMGAMVVNAVCQVPDKLLHDQDADGEHDGRKQQE